MIIKKNNSIEEESFLFESFPECDEYLQEKFPVEMPTGMEGLHYLWTDEKMSGEGHVKKVVQTIDLVDEIKYETVESWTVTQYDLIEMNPTLYVIQDLKTGLVLDIYKNKFDAAMRMRQGRNCLEKETCTEKGSETCLDCSTCDQVCLEREIKRWD